MDIVSSLGMAYATYFVGTLSPGPANLAIISTSLSYGRSAGVATALGVVAGSVMWGLISRADKRGKNREKGGYFGWAQLG